MHGSILTPEAPAPAGAVPADAHELQAVEPSVPAAVAALLALDARAHLVQTHISWIVLDGDHVYKVKKPVSLGFLDYSTLARRLEACRREVILNRRLCVDLYRGIVPIFEEEGRVTVGRPFDPALCQVTRWLDREAPARPLSVEPLWEAGRPPRRVVEYAVWMRRLPEERMLTTLLARGEATADMLERVAERLAVFHAAAATGPGVDEHGTLAAIRANVEENFEQVRPFVGRLLDETAWRTIRDRSRAFMDRHADLFAARVARGRIRDGHGDVHVGSVCMTEPPAIFDCVEFSDRYRCGDVASEVAFLAMDLGFYGRADLAQAFVGAYLERSRDWTLPALLDFYTCYRAYVRGKVAALQAAEPEVSAPERLAAIRRARRYFELADAYAGRLGRPAG